MDSKQNPTTELLNILSKAMEANIYGSVEVYLEDGQITQISQRIIRKIKKAKPQVRQEKTKSTPSKRKDENINIKYQNS